MIVKSINVNWNDRSINGFNKREKSYKYVFGLINMFIFVEKRDIGCDNIDHQKDMLFYD